MLSKGVRGTLKRLCRLDLGFTDSLLFVSSQLPGPPKKKSYSEINFPIRKWHYLQDLLLTGCNHSSWKNHWLNEIKPFSFTSA